MTENIYNGDRKCSKSFLKHSILFHTSLYPPSKPQLLLTVVIYKFHFHTQSQWQQLKSCSPVLQATCKLRYLLGLLDSDLSRSGGSVLAQLLESKFDLAKYPISVLVRGEDKAKDLRSKGFHPILFNSLDEIDVLEKAATEHDGKHSAIW